MALPATVGPQALGPLLVAARQLVPRLLGTGHVVTEHGGQELGPPAVLAWWRRHRNQPRRHRRRGSGQRSGEVKATCTGGIAVPEGLGGVGRAGDQLLDLVGVEVALPEQGSRRSGRHGGREGRAGADAVARRQGVAALGPRGRTAGGQDRDHAAAGSDQVGLGHPLRGRPAGGPGRHGVVGTSARTAFREPADRQQQRVEAWRADRALGAAVAGGHDHDDAPHPELLQRPRERVELVGQRAAGGQREVDHVDLRVGGHGLQAQEDAHEAGAAVVPGHPDVEHLRCRCDTGVPAPGRGAAPGDQAGHEGPVAVPVAGALPGDVDVREAPGEVGDVGDAGVDHGHLHAPPVPHAGGGGCRGQAERLADGGRRPTRIGRSGQAQRPIGNHDVGRREHRVAGEVGADPAHERQPVENGSPGGLHRGRDTGQAGLPRGHDDAYERARVRHGCGSEGRAQHGKGGGHRHRQRQQGPAVRTGSGGGGHRGPRPARGAPRRGRRSGTRRPRHLARAGAAPRSRWRP